YVARNRRIGIENAAALLVDHRSLEVRAAVGSADFFDERIAGQVDGTRARRSPGSTLKPFVYALGLEQGVIHPATMLRDVPPGFGTRVLSQEAAFLVLDMLEDGPRPGARPGSAPRLPVAWKTGTSWGFRDAWTVGVFGPYVLAIWVGNFSGEGNPAFVGAQAAA